jgi:hypothetical protein
VGLALADPPLLLDLFEQVGDPDAAGPAAVERRLDGGADVVGVDVAVPHAVAADDHDGVADAGPHLLERPDGVVGRLEQVHDLVAEVADVVRLVVLVLGQPVEVGRRRVLEVGRLGHGAAVDDVEQRVDEQEEAGAAGVDHAGVLQDRQQFGGAGEAGPPTGDGRLEHVEQRPVLGRPGGRRLGRLAGDGEDGALDRLHHGAVGRFGRRREGLGQARPVGAVIGHEGVADASQHLGHDDARVAPGPHERAVADGPADRGRVVTGRLQLGHHRVERERHVGARVAVGHGVDVEPVDRLLVGLQRVPEGHGCRPKVGGAQARKGGHGRIVVTRERRVGQKSRTSGPKLW